MVGTVAVGGYNHPAACNREARPNRRTQSEIALVMLKPNRNLRIVAATKGLHQGLPCLVHTPVVDEDDFYRASLGQFNQNRPKLLLKFRNVLRFIIARDNN